MFDIGFWELAIIGVVALLVIGPERLPKVARTVGLWVGRMRGFVMSVKADVDRELRADELKRIMEEQARSTGLHEIVEETRESLQESKESLMDAKASLDEMNKPDYLVKAMPQEKDDKDGSEAQADDKSRADASGGSDSGTKKKDDE